MYRQHYTLLLTTIIALGFALSEAQAQVYYYPSGTRTVIPQRRVIVGAQNQVYSNNGVQYQSYRPSYGQSQVYTNNGYYVQPNGTYTQTAPTYYQQPSTTYYQQPSTTYYSYPSTQQSYYNNPTYSSQPSTVYGNSYGTGYYSTPQQATNASVGAAIGNAIGGGQGAQVGAAIGATIRP